jgi:hypothetical protein
MRMAADQRTLSATVGWPRAARQMRMAARCAADADGRGPAERHPRHIRMGDTASHPSDATHHPAIGGDHGGQHAKRAPGGTRARTDVGGLSLALGR